MGNQYVEFLPGEKHASKNAATSDFHESFKDCGILLTDEDVVIDIDHLSKEQIQEFIRRFNVKTQIVWTNRGAHLYYKKPVTRPRALNGICALGFGIETKNKSNSPNGVTFKRDGVAREIENEGVREELPIYFYIRKNFKSQVGLGEGDGRNNAMFAHSATLGEFKDKNKILTFINEVLYDKPLESKEFESVSRSVANNTDKLTEYDVATTFLTGDHPCVTYQQYIWYWEDNKYVSTAENHYLLQKMIFAKVPKVSTKFVEEVMKQILIRAQTIVNEEFDIRLKNGYLRNGEFIETDQYYEFTPYYIDIDYIEDCEPVQEVDDYINQLTDNDEDYRKLLLESLGYCFVVNRDKMTSLGKFFMIRGDGRNGKGTLLSIIRSILGKENCTSLSIQQLSDHAYNSTVIGKLANLGDDIPPDAINNKDMKLLKNIATADEVSTRSMYKASKNVIFTAKMFFTTNSDIKTFEKGFAYQRRVMWLPMFNKVEKPDPLFIHKMTSKKALRYWIRLMIEGYYRLHENGQFTESELLAQYNKEYHMTNDPMIDFVENVDITVEIINRNIGEVKESFLEYVGDTESKLFNSKNLQEYLKTKGIVYKNKKAGGKQKKSFQWLPGAEQE